MWSWRVGAIKGIDLKIHATFPLVLLWAAVQFGLGQEQGLFHALFGVMLILLLFGCVLLHELGHALVARRYQIPVEEIVLLPIGGLARFRVMQDDAQQEFFIALAGPMVNVVLSLLLLPFLLWPGAPLDLQVIDRLAQHTDGNELRVILLLLLHAMREISLMGMLAYLFFANVMLVLFNLIPAFPMDGGRILRALLAALLPYKLATQLAVRLGQLLALLFAIGGVRYNPALLIIALFIFITGGAELQRIKLREILARGQVSHYMIQGLHPLYPQWSLYSARMLAQQTGQRAFPVMEEGELLGLLTVREMKRHPMASTVAEAMVQNFSILPPAGSLYNAQLTLQGNDQFAGAVMEGGVLLGLLSVEDIERAYHSLQRELSTQIA